MRFVRPATASYRVMLLYINDFVVKNVMNIKLTM